MLNFRSVSSKFVLIAMLLAGCSKESTENIEPRFFEFNVFVTYLYSTGEGSISIDLQDNPLLSSPTPLSLGDGDSLVITSGEFSTVVDTITNGAIRLPITVELGGKLSVDFQRNALSLKKIVVDVSDIVVPSISTDTDALTLNNRISNAKLDFGIPIPHEIVNGQRFGYAAYPSRCYNEVEGYTEQYEEPQLVGSFKWSDIPIYDKLDEASLDQKISAELLLRSEEKNSLISGIYSSCDIVLFSTIELFNNVGVGVNNLISYFEEKEDPRGYLRLIVISDPTTVNVAATAL